MRTYIPTLVKIVRVVCVYITRYDAALRKNLPTNALPAFEVLSTACAAFLAVVELTENP